MLRFCALAPIILAGCTGNLNHSRDELWNENLALAATTSAKDVVEGLEDRRKNGEAATPAFLELYYTWSRRLAAAKWGQARTYNDRLTAVEAHLERMKRMQDALSHVTDQTTSIHISQLNYYVAEAELFVTRAKNP